MILRTQRAYGNLTANIANIKLRVREYHHKRLILHIKNYYNP